MHVVEKKARGHSCLYLVESVREGRKVRQRIIQPMGRKDVLAASGQLERLLQSAARHCECSVVLAAMEAGDVACTRIGAPLLFGRLRARAAPRWGRGAIPRTTGPTSPR